MSGADYEERLKTSGRNDRCPCGSGKKYKKCHLAEDESKRSAALKALEEEAKAKAAENADADDDTSAADKGTRSARRKKDQAGSKGQAADAKPKNIPRRGAV